MVTFRSVLLAVTLISAVPAFAQTGQDPHHPDGTAGAQGQTTQASPPAGMMGQGMMRPGMMGGATMGQGQSSSGTMPMMSMMMRSRSGAEHMEGRLAYIQAELKITQAQTSAWNAFVDATRSNAASMSEMRNAMMSKQGAFGTLPDRLAFEEKAVAAHLAALKLTEEAVTKLYGVLSDDQKKAADSIILGPMGMPMGMQ